MENIKGKEKTDKKTWDAIIVTVVGFAITLVIALSSSIITSNNIGNQLGIGGIGATITVAVLIYVLQNKTSKELTDLTVKQKKTSEGIAELTLKIHNMTSQIHDMTEKIHDMASTSSEIRKVRIDSFKHFALYNLGKVNGRYNKLLKAMEKYTENKDNKKEVFLYAKNPTTESIIASAQMMILFHFQYSKNFIKDIDLVRYLELDLNSLGDEFREVTMFDYDQYENNSNDYTEEIDMILYDFNIRIEHVKEKIKKIDEYIQKIEKE